MKTITVATTSQVKAGEILAVAAEDRKVMLSKIDDKIYAVENKCPHLGMPLAKGKVCNNTVKCRWHGATFDLKTGENVSWVDSFVGVPLPEWSLKPLSLGKSPQNLQSFEVGIDGENVTVAV
jgi:nitrite reductase/ring-hydroxylating ferredoxin subunit